MKTASCFGPAHILLPGENIPLEKWGCVACDQFTSDRAYWEQADAAVGDCPSTLRLILPEVYLEDEDAAQRVENIHAAMDEYSRDTARNELRDTLSASGVEHAVFWDDAAGIFQ